MLSLRDLPRVLIVVEACSLVAMLLLAVGEVTSVTVDSGEGGAFLIGDNGHGSAGLADVVASRPFH